MRSRRRSGPLPHVLVAGESADLPTIRTVLALLPEDAYGQVFVELSSEDPAPNIQHPARITVTTLVRDPAGTVGHRLTQAVDGWAEEWLTDAPDPARDLCVWLGHSVPARPLDQARILQRL